MSYRLKRGACLTGIGVTPYSRESGKSVLALAAEATLGAIADAGLERSDIDGVVCFHENDSPSVRDVATALGLPRVNWWADIESGGVATCNIIANAAMAVSSGTAAHVLCFRAMNGRSGVRMGQFGVGTQARGWFQFLHPYGFGTPPQMFAMIAQRHMAEFGTKPEHLGIVATTLRAHARLNPRATRRDPMSMDDYLGSRMIASPLRLFDCCQETDGACAVVVSSAERARDLRQRPIQFLASAHSSPAGARPSMDQLKSLTTGLASSGLGETLFSRTGLTPKDVDVALLYDAFTIFVLVLLEDLGFCGRGESGPFVEGGRIGLRGELPVNPHGGLLSEAYIHGLNHVVEAVDQLRGTAGERQVKGAEIALVTGYGPSASAMLLARN